MRSETATAHDAEIVKEALGYLIDMYRSNAGWTAAMAGKPLSRLPESVRPLIAKAARAEAELQRLEEQDAK
jgi:uncharacterized membrane protein